MKGIQGSKSDDFLRVPRNSPDHAYFADQTS